MIIKAFVRFRFKVDNIIKVMPQEPELLLDVSTLLVPTRNTSEALLQLGVSTPRLLWTTGAGAVPGGVYTAETSAAHGRVYTTRA
jgi:hypothetical protein